MLNYQRVKDFNQEGFYLQPLTRIGNYINSKKRDVKEHRGCHEPKYRVFSNQQRTSNKTRIWHNMTWHSLISRISYSKPGNCNLLDFQLLCWFSNMSCLTKSRFKMCVNQENLCNFINKQEVEPTRTGVQKMSLLNVTLMGWTTQQLKTTGCRRKKTETWGPLLYL